MYKRFVLGVEEPVQFEIVSWYRLCKVKPKSRTIEIHVDIEVGGCLMQHDPFAEISHRSFLQNYHSALNSRLSLYKYLFKCQVVREFTVLISHQVLLAMKANVEDRGIKGDCTPLMEAASGGYVDIVKLLIAHGADVNAQSSAG